ncbi:class I glutamine amidotransferase-like protein [Mycena alexandri]|uniref:Class I glutamine amidotransferase-like protein n=1 Tax=Mycena alexandri TaxID=1745969 RepID=A0AAD6T9C4_9AGAR|nr:class I glutamine amidotransferase-like protein [Mycena alexandri]
MARARRTSIVSNTYHLPEAAHPHYILAPHATVNFAGPLDQTPSLMKAASSSFFLHGVPQVFESDAECKKFLIDATTIKGKLTSKLASIKKLSEVSAKDYATIFYVEFYQAGKIPSAVCHGPAALVGATDADGKSIFAGKAVTGFSNDEEIQINMVKDVPFLLEDKIISLDGKYENANAAWALKVVVDGILITG